ncbi:hypothetical protein RN001_013979 [Aquatica leii]|uniref:KATNIP domain-containing protein n=1 Tax=Aquatica leii TaxID=1421715 RepID=A0AAN7SE90_9COLE|nr:hypothetical protein RN001_013979 [Aquatica leii]
MSISKKCDDVNEMLNAHQHLSIPSHGCLPKWLGEIADNVIKRPPTRSEGATDRKYHFVGISALKGGSSIPSKIDVPDRLSLDKKNTSLLEKSKQFRKTSLAAQIYARNRPRHIKLSNFEYLVPRLDEDIDFVSLQREMNQAELEKSWISLSKFQKTHKGRLDSAKISNRTRENTSHSEIETVDCYSPSILENRTPVRSKSELSHYVPFYVYSNIRKATEPDLTKNLSTKSKSSEDIYDFNFKFGANRQTSYVQLSTIDKQLSEYKIRVDQENRLREKIINELLTENERITERLKQRQKRNVESMLKMPSVEDLSSGVRSRRSIPETTHLEHASFVIPELPVGRLLQINILSTWGDKHYVGLNGIEIFGKNGKIVDVKKIHACPADVNILPENKNDPRVVQNLLDGVNRTQDDVHLWLAPFEDGLKHYIVVEFAHLSTVAMIRIWNYNKSRIYSYRGVRHAVITLDDIPIFKGEIAKACGGILGGVDAFGDTILFTTDEEILDAISKNDKSYATLSATSKPETLATTDRPPTVATLENRPYTGVAPVEKSNNNASQGQILLGASRLDIVLLSNWGCANIIGLTGLEVIGTSDNVIPILEENMQCNVVSKINNLKKLRNGFNVTTDVNSMWWTTHKPGQKVVITIQFNQFVYMSGIRIWNYNESPETTYAGVQALKILLDGKQLINPARKDEVFLLRRAPGNTHYDFVQDLRFSDCSSNDNNYSSLSYSFNALSLYRNEMPEGFVYQFIIFSTWGDQYYCGLNEIEIYNEYGTKIQLEEQNICAYPESINVLPGVSGDIRTPDKLIDSVTFDSEGAHSWLAPVIPKCLNRIYIVLDNPTTVSLIKLWNYSKTPSRGVKEFGVLVDDLLVYNGILDKYVKRNGVPSYRSIIFTDDKKTLEQEVNTYIRQTSYKQEVVLMDDNRIATVGSLPNPDQTLRPFTSVNPFDKGYLTQ